MYIYIQQHITLPRSLAKKTRTNTQHQGGKRYGRLYVPPLLYLSVFRAIISRESSERRITELCAFSYHFPPLLPVQATGLNSWLTLLVLHLFLCLSAISRPSLYVPTRPRRRGSLSLLYKSTAVSGRARI